MKTPTSLNGVNVAKMKETMAAIEGNPDIAQFRFSATNRWFDGGHNQTRIEDFFGACATQQHRTSFVFEEDEPPLLLGNDIGANPVEFVLTGLAGCLTTSLVYHAAARGIRVKRVESRLEGDLDLRGFLGMSPDIRNGYEGIKVIMRVDADATEEQIQELVRLAQQRSPVFDIVTNSVPVEVEGVVATSEQRH